MTAPLSSFAAAIATFASGNVRAATAYTAGFEVVTAEAMRASPIGKEAEAMAAATKAWNADVAASGLRGHDLVVALRAESDGDPAAFVRLVRLIAAAGGAR